MAEVDHVGEIAQRDRGQAVPVGQRPRLGEDLGQLRLVPLGPPVDGFVRTSVIMTLTSKNYH